MLSTVEPRAKQVRLLVLGVGVERCVFLRSRKGSNSTSNIIGTEK